MAGYKAGQSKYAAGKGRAYSGALGSGGTYNQAKSGISTMQGSGVDTAAREAAQLRARKQAEAAALVKATANKVASR